MIELKTSYTLSDVPYITFDVLDTYAERLVADFAPERLNCPGVTNVEAFAEYYLGLSMRYFLICYERKALGFTSPLY